MEEVRITGKRYFFSDASQVAFGVLMRLPTWKMHENYELIGDEGVLRRMLYFCKDLDVCRAGKFTLRIRWG